MKSRARTLSSIRGAAGNGGLESLANSPLSVCGRGSASDPVEIIGDPRNVSDAFVRALAEFLFPEQMKGEGHLTTPAPDDATVEGRVVDADPTA